MNERPEERIRGAVELAGGSMKTTVAALLESFGEESAGEAEAALARVGVTITPSLAGADPGDYVLLHTTTTATTISTDLVPGGGGTGEEPAPAPGPDGEYPTEAGPIGRDLTHLAQAGELHPVVGREREIDQLLEVLSRRLRRGAVLVGAPGVGKSAIVEGLAQRLVAGECPAELRDTKISEISPAAAIAAAPDPGSLASLTLALLADAREANRVLFIDDFQVALAYGGPALGMSGHLRGALRRGEIALIAALSDADYFQAVQADPSLERLLEPIRVDELSAAATLEVLRSVYPRMAEPEAPEPDAALLEGLIEATERHLPNRHLPDKALDVLDRVLARSRSRGDEPTPEMVADVLAEMTGLPLGSEQRAAGIRIAGLAERLRARVIGQEDAIDTLTSKLALKVRRLDLRPERPNGVFLFTGPTGVGKTQVARTLAEHLFGSQDRMLRLDMSEHSESHHVSQLLGAPPGYVGYEQGSPLLAELERHPFCVLLLDEMEKAHPAVHRLFLQVFEDGMLTTAAGRRVYFSDAIVVMTANVDMTKRRPGFSAGDPADERIGVLEGLDRHFPRELVNRIDAVCEFRVLEPADVRRILEEVLLPGWNQAHAREGIGLRLTEEALEHLATAGYSRELGARELERVVERELLAKVAVALDADGSRRLLVAMEAGELVVTPEPSPG